MLFVDHSAIIDLVCQKDEEMGFCNSNIQNCEDNMYDDVWIRYNEFR